MTNYFGFLGLLTNCIWICLKNKTQILIGQACACLFMGIHYALLDANTAALITAVAGVQALLAIPLAKHPHFRYCYLASTLLTPYLGFISWHGLPSIFSMTALICVNIGNYQSKLLLQRRWLIIAILAWIVHNSLIGSIPTLLSNALTLTLSLWRYQQTRNI